MYEPVMEQAYLPNCTKYVLPPTPSGSSTDTASSPSASDHGEHNTCSSGNYNTQLHNSPIVDQLPNTQQDKQLNYQLPSFQTGAELLHSTTQLNVHAWSQAQYKSNHPALPCNPWSNQVTNTPSEQVQSPLTSSSNKITDDQPQKLQVKTKRPRTHFSAFQITELEGSYQSYKYLSRVQKMELSKKLNLDEIKIKVWYQNRRMKDKKNGSDEKQGVFRKRKDKATLSCKTSGFSEDVPFSIKTEKVTLEPSTSITNRLLTHSVWAKRHQRVSPASTGYGSYVPNSYHWNSSPYSNSLHNVGYPLLNNDYNGYHGQYSNETSYSPYLAHQYNTPIPQPNIKEENTGNNLSEQEELAMNFAIAQEFLSKTIQF